MRAKGLWTVSLLIGLAACDLTPDWTLTEDEPSYSDPSKYLCRPIEDRLEFCTVFGLGRGEKEGRCLLFFEVRNRSTRGEGTPFAFKTDNSSMVSATLVDDSPERRTSLQSLSDDLASQGIEAEAISSDQMHGELLSLEANVVAWFYSGFGQGRTMRDLFAFFDLLTADRLAVSLPIDNNPVPLSLEFSLNGLEEKLLEHAPAECRWRQWPEEPPFWGP